MISNILNSIKSNTVNSANWCWTKLGTAIESIKKFAGRVVSWIKTPADSAKKTAVIATSSLSKEVVKNNSIQIVDVKYPTQLNSAKPDASVVEAKSADVADEQPIVVVEEKPTTPVLNNAGRTKRNAAVNAEAASSLQAAQGKHTKKRAVTTK